MIKIKRLEDIDKLLLNKEIYSNELMKHIELYFKQLWENLSSDGEELQEFSLEEHGYVAILEEDDDFEDLREIGLSKEDRGLIGATPEWIEVKEFEDGSQFHQIGLLYKNEYMMMLYLSKRIIDKNKKLEAWIKKNI